MPRRDRDTPPSSSRRAFLIGTGAAVAWTAPIITAAPAAAQASGLGSPEFVAASSSSVDFGFSVTLPRPSGTQNGDAMIAVITTTGAATFTTPAGWTLLSGPDSGDGSPTGAQARTALFAYTGPTAPAVSTTFPVSDSGLIRGAIATFRPAAGGFEVQIDATATRPNPDTPTPEFPGVSAPVGPLRTVVYLGGTGIQGFAQWTAPNPGQVVAVQTIGQGADPTISYTTDVATSPGLVNGALVDLAAGNPATDTDSVTYTVALATI